MQCILKYHFCSGFLGVALLLSSCTPQNKDNPLAVEAIIKNEKEGTSRKDSLQAGTKNRPYRIIVLPAYDEIANAGIAEFSLDLENIFKDDSAFSLVPWPYVKDIPPYYMVYNIKYADTFFTNPGVDIVFMHRIKYSMRGSHTTDTRLSLEAKFIHKDSRREHLVFRHEDIGIAEASRLIKQEADEIKWKIIEGIAME